MQKISLLKTNDSYSSHALNTLPKLWRVIDSRRFNYVQANKNAYLDAINNPPSKLIGIPIGQCRKGSRGRLNAGQLSEEYRQSDIGYG